MAVVLKRPQRGLLPVGNLKIDWSHPLANGLVACYVPGIQRGTDLTGISGDLADASFGTSATPVQNLAQDGPICDMFITNSRFIATAPPALKTWSGLTLFWRGVMDGTNPTDYPALIGVLYDNAGSSPFSVATIHRRSGSTNIMAQSNSAGTQFDTPTFSVALNSTANIGASFTVGGNIVPYLNGVSQSTTALASAPNTTATSLVTMGSGLVSPAGVVPHASTYIGCIWNRALSADEHALLNADPYCFLIPAEGEMPALFIPSVGGSFLAAWARGSNLPVIGTGNY